MAAVAGGGGWGGAALRGKKRKEGKKERKTLPDGRTRLPVTSRSKQDGEIFTDNNLIKQADAGSSAVDNKHLICCLQTVNMRWTHEGMKKAASAGGWDGA